MSMSNPERLDGRVTSARNNPAPEHWYEDRDELHAFCCALHAALSLEVDTLLYLISKPWKWTPEYLVWVQAGRPEVAPELLTFEEKQARERAEVG